MSFGVDEEVCVTATVEGIDGRSYLDNLDVFIPLDVPRVSSVGCITFGRLDLLFVPEREQMAALDRYVEMHGVREGVGRFEDLYDRDSSDLLASVE